MVSFAPFRIVEKEKSKRFSFSRVSSCPKNSQIKLNAPITSMKVNIERQLPKSRMPWPIVGARAGIKINIIMISDMIFAISRPTNLSRIIAKVITLQEAPPSP